MENKKIGLVGIAIVFVLIASLSMGCIDNEEVTEGIDEMQAQIDNLEQQIADAEDKATEEAFMAELDELRAQIEDLEELELPTTYLIVRHTETEYNESFSAWGVCGRGEHHIKDKALERAEDFADDLSIEDNISDIVVKYDGREREYVHEDYCYMTYYYEVTWIENEYEEQVVSAFGVEAWLDCTQ